MENFKKKFAYNDPDLRDFFVKNGYVIIKNLIDRKIIDKLSTYCWSRIKKLKKLSKKKKIPEEYELWSIAIISSLEKTKLYNDYIKSKKLLDLLKIFLGPDICTLGYNSLWINNPSNKNAVINKKPHVDAWTGTSPNTLFFKLFLTDVDNYNGLTVFPGTNLQGFIPVKSRLINSEDFNVNFSSVNLNNLRRGDCVLWHALTLHSTTGQSDKNVRISMTARFSSTETDFSSQERALGNQVLCVGPLNEVKRLIGNDLFSPFRTYKTFVGTDKRLSELYSKKQSSEINRLLDLLD